LKPHAGAIELLVLELVDVEVREVVTQPASAVALRTLKSLVPLPIGEFVTRPPAASPKLTQ
jgi:hypothetical protein